MRGGPGTDEPGQITYTSATLQSVLLRAYDVQPYQLNGPDWLSSLRYDIVAKIPPGSTKEQLCKMLQNLLAERFHLALHHETKELAGYGLIVGRNGSKLKQTSEKDADAPPADLSSPPKTDPNGFPILERPGIVFMEAVRDKAVVTCLTAKAQPVSALADMLSRAFRIPILDKTGLTGKFDFTMFYAPQAPGALPPPPTLDAPAVAADEGAPNLIDAVQLQLGLKLNAAKMPVDVLVIDRVDPAPMGN